MLKLIGAKLKNLTEAAGAGVLASNVPLAELARELSARQHALVEKALSTYVDREK